jgi:hypothetical protein
LFRYRFTRNTRRRLMANPETAAAILKQTAVAARE